MSRSTHTEGATGDRKWQIVDRRSTVCKRAIADRDEGRFDRQAYDDAERAVAVDAIDPFERRVDDVQREAIVVRRMRKAIGCKRRPYGNL